MKLFADAKRTSVNWIETRFQQGKSERNWCENDNKWCADKRKWNNFYIYFLYRFEARRKGGEKEEGMGTKANNKTTTTINGFPIHFLLWMSFFMPLWVGRELSALSIRNPFSIFLLSAQFNQHVFAKFEERLNRLLSLEPSFPKALSTRLILESVYYCLSIAKTVLDGKVNVGGRETRQNHLRFVIVSFSNHHSTAVDALLKSSRKALETKTKMNFKVNPRPNIGKTNQVVGRSKMWMNRSEQRRETWKKC